MPHGRPDWYNITPMIQVHASEDVNELAARLIDLNVYDRRGNVIHQETFASGLHGVIVGTSAGGSYGLSTAYARTDGFSLRMSHTGPSTDNVWIEHVQGMQFASSTGMETSWNIVGQSAVIFMGITRYDGNYWHEASLKYDIDSGELYYLGSDDTFHILDACLYIPRIGSIFHFMKLAVDWDNGNYLRAMIDSHIYSLVNISYYKEASILSPQEGFHFGIRGNDISSGSIYLDSIICTINEE